MVPTFRRRVGYHWVFKLMFIITCNIPWALSWCISNLVTVVTSTDLPCINYYPDCQSECLCIVSPHIRFLFYIFCTHLITLLNIYTVIHLVAPDVSDESFKTLLGSGCKSKTAFSKAAFTHLLAPFGYKFLVAFVAVDLIQEFRSHSNAYQPEHSASLAARISV